RDGAAQVVALRGVGRDQGVIAGARTDEDERGGPLGGQGLEAGALAVHGQRHGAVRGRDAGRGADRYGHGAVAIVGHRRGGQASGGRGPIHVQCAGRRAGVEYALRGEVRRQAVIAGGRTGQGKGRHAIHERLRKRRPAVHGEGNVAGGGSRRRGHRHRDRRVAVVGDGRGRDRGRGRGGGGER